MTVSCRLLFLMLLLLLSSFGNFVVVVVGQSPVDPAVSVDGNSHFPSALPSEAVPISDPSPPPPVVQSQPISFFPTPTRLTLLPPTTILSTSTNPPSEAAATALTSIPVTLQPAIARSTPPILTLPVSPLMVPTSSSAMPPTTETTLPSTVPRGSPPPSSQTTLPTRAATTIPVNTAPSSIPQRCQLTFDNKLDNVKVTDYDLWTQRSEATNQLAALCEIPADRITNLGIEANASGNLVLRFTIAQGWPVYTDQALQNLKDKLNASTPALKLAGLPLTSPVAIFWTDNGPCPTDVCLNNGICDVTLSGNYTCSCDVSHTGPRCQDDAQPLIAAGGGRDLRLLALLVLLAIPIAVAVIVGFHFGRRRQEKEQLRRAFDLRDVRTMGPKSMLSLPMESGIRNDMYDTRSFALAFTDTTFSKAGGGSLTPPASSSSTNTTTSTTSSITKGDDNDNGGDGLF